MEGRNDLVFIWAAVTSKELWKWTQVEVKLSMEGAGRWTLHQRIGSGMPPSLDSLGSQDPGVSRPGCSFYGQQYEGLGVARLQTQG